MNSKKFFIVFCILFVAAGTGFAIYSQTLDEDVAPQNQAGESEQNSNINVSSPQPNSVVSSPLIVTGEARGTWYFEASFPVKLYDANNNLLAQAPAQALSDWMTTDFVSFSVTLTFPTPSTQTGTLVLEKDNPSGLPQNDDSVSIPVSF
ncbi:MAG: hypothetical protein UY73_C0003G0012 [Parcubacteria group bacterium GW2011_GWA2_52_8]|nr:MAG: hypothetical protein UY73_C0003G0012 [Parcubacteria group bacterium GW2011_GWA2_52_8]